MGIGRNVETLSKGVLYPLTSLGPDDLGRASGIELICGGYVGGSKRFVETVCQSDHLVSGRNRNGVEEAAVIGQLEQRVPMPIEGVPAHAAGGVRRSRGKQITAESV